MYVMYDGFRYFHGWTTDLADAAAVGAAWLSDQVPDFSAMAERFPSLVPNPLAQALDRGDAITCTSHRVGSGTQWRASCTNVETGEVLVVDEHAGGVSAHRGGPRRAPADRLAASGRASGERFPDSGGSERGRSRIFLPVGKRRAASIGAVEASGIHHVGVAVVDLDEAVRTYERLFGGRLEHRARVEEQGVEAASIRIGESRVELLAALGDDTPVGKFLAKRGPGMHHVAYEVADIHAALAGLAEAGAELIDAEPRQGMFGLEVAFVHPESVHGVLSEVVSDG